MSDDAVVDRTRLAGLCAGDEALALELLGMLVDEAVPLVEELGRQVRASDAGRIHELAHSLKGIAGNVGAVELRAAAERLQTGTETRAAPAPQLLAAEFDAVAAALARVRETQRSWEARAAERRRDLRFVSEFSFIALRTTPGMRRAGIIAAAILIAIAAAAVAFGRQNGPPGPAVLPLLTSLVIATELLTSYILFLEFALVRARWLAALATAYVLTALVAIPYLLVFPGVFAPNGLFGATPSSSVALWLVWHAAFPAIVFLTVLARRSGSVVEPGATGRVIAIALGSSVAVGGRRHRRRPRVRREFSAARRERPLHNVDDVRLHAGRVALIGVTALAFLYATSRLLTTRDFALAFDRLGPGCSMLDAFMAVSADRFSVLLVRRQALHDALVVGGLDGVFGRHRPVAPAARRRQRGTSPLPRVARRTFARSRRTRATSSCSWTARRMIILDANAAAFEAFGYTRDELIGSPLSIIQGHVGRIAVTDEVLERGLLFEREYWRKDGTSFPVEVYGRMIEIDGRAYYVSTTRDITERFIAREEIARALDHAIEASRLKSQFLATMSHEIRTPMNGIIGMTNLLLRTPLAGDQREFAVTVRDSAHSLLLIINDILDFSKMEAGKIDLESIAFDPAHVVNGVAKLLHGTAQGKGLDLIVALSPRIPVTVMGDPTRLRQILVNLVGNAVKFTEAGEVSIGARLEDDDGTTTVMRFDVTDTGIGIPEDVSDKLFNAFVQADGSMTRRYGGTGLGLAISRRLTELMGGEIDVRANPAGGSIFTFTASFGHAEPVDAGTDPTVFAALRACAR